MLSLNEFWSKPRLSTGQVDNNRGIKWNNNRASGLIPEWLNCEVEDYSV